MDQGETVRGMAQILGDEAAGVAMRTDGRCARDTLANLEAGTTGKPLDPATLQRAREQAIGILEEVLRTYTADVAAGEVGAQGTGMASEADPPSGECPTGLLYGRIQSGKTLAMITFSALALDNGFRVIVVLTSDNIKLVEQTADRFRALEGPLVRNSTQMDRWADDAEHIRKEIEGNGLVLVCAKNQSHLSRLIDFLELVEASRYPSIVLDDEADQATPDTTTNARSSPKPSSPKHGSTISRRIVRNDAADEDERSVRKTLRHNVFLQVTATPYALLLQNTDSPFRPKFTKLLAPGQGYTGGESFFSEDHIEEKLPPLVFVPEEESDALDRGTDRAPQGLVSALSFFLVSASAQIAKDPSVRGRAQNFLCHTSQKTTEHEKLSGLIRAFLNTVGDELRKPEVGGEVAIHLQAAYAEMARTLRERPPFEQILANLRVRLPRREVIVVNSTGSNADFTRNINFIVGGNILGRGLTIENLLVTYYLRRARVSQMDTMLQHARMFGYREPLMAYTRVFLPESLAGRFHRIHVAESNLRKLLSDPNRRAKIPVQVSEGLRATRLAVLDMAAIEVYTPGDHIYPGAPRSGSGARKEHDRAEAAILGLLGGSFVQHKEGNLKSITIDDVLNLLPFLPYQQPDEGNWDPKGIRGTLSSVQQRFHNRAALFCRTMSRTTFTQGALSGAALKALRADGRPVLCLFKDIGRQYSKFREEYWYPSLVLPDEEDMPAHIFNTDE